MGPCSFDWGGEGIRGEKVGSTKYWENRHCYAPLIHRLNCLPACLPACLVMLRVAQDHAQKLQIAHLLDIRNVHYLVRSKRGTELYSVTTNIIIRMYIQYRHTCIDAVLHGIGLNVNTDID
jgi:hypothetical protein